MTENLKVYGQLSSEKMTSENTIARQIVKEIGDFGINDRQRWLIIYQLSMELENIDEMKKLTTFIKEIKGSEIFVSKLYGSPDNEEIE